MRKASNAAELQEEQEPNSERRVRARRNAAVHKSFVLAMCDALQDILREETKNQ